MSSRSSVVHQLAHWTGPRLGRDIDHPVGSIGAAREELRTNVASLMLGDRLRIGWNPGDHAAYAKPWAELLTKDPTELMRAAWSAEAITQHVIGMERARSTPELSAEQMQQLAGKTIDRTGRRHRAICLPRQTTAFTCYGNRST